MSICSNLRQQIYKGLNGDNWGLSMGLPKVESVIDGVTRETYTLIFSGTGVGKTSFCLYSYVYRPIMDNLDNDNIKVIYFSLEMSKEILFAKILCIYMAETFGIEISTKEMLSKGRGKILDTEVLAKIELVLDFFEKNIEPRFVVVDGTLNADKYKEVIMKEVAKDGYFVDKTYFPNNPKKIIQVITDHLNLTRPAAGRSKKEEIDMISSYGVSIRNLCGVSITNIMQINRDSTSMDRRKGGFHTPQLSDIKESGSPSEDAEIVIGLFSPVIEKLSTHRGYDIKQMGSLFRSIFILKNRYGDMNFEVACAFYAKVNIWKELPKAEDISNYEKYTKMQNFKKCEINI